MNQKYDHLWPAHVFDVECDRPENDCGFHKIHFFLISYFFYFSKGRVAFMEDKPPRDTETNKDETVLKNKTEYTHNLVTWQQKSPYLLRNSWRSCLRPKAWPDAVKRVEYFTQVALLTFDRKIHEVGLLLYLLTVFGFFNFSYNLLNRKRDIKN